MCRLFHAMLPHPGANGPPSHRSWFESPKAGKQISAVYGGDVARTQRLQRVEVVPIKKMAFETFKPTYAFECAEVALHQIVNGNVTEIICRHGRQHGKPDVGG